MKPVSKKKELMLYNETAKLRVLGVLFRHPEKEFSLSDLAKESGAAKANIGVILTELHSLGYIEIVKLTKIWRIQANRTNWNFIKAKIINNLALIYHSGIIEYLIEHNKNPKAIVLFGSFRKGEDTTLSDIDIAIESEAGRDKFDSFYLSDFVHKSERNKVEELEKILCRKIQIHTFNRKNIDINVFKNIANGIVLWGFLDVKV